MRITAFILTICSLHVAAKGVSQTITLSGKDIPLKTVFAEIKKQCGYVVTYNGELVDDEKQVSVEVKDEPLLQFLDKTLRAEKLDYIIQNKTIVVQRHDDESLLEKIVKRFTPPIDVRGRVVDEKGDPVEGATVTVKGTNRSVATNANGEFVLSGLDEDAAIVISSVNIETREIKINGQKILSIATNRKSTNLNEVVINKGYYTEKKRFSVGNTATVTAAEIEKQPVQNPLLALQGRVPGMEVTQLTGMPGGGVTVRIQGRNSINSGLDPLIVVDGVPIFSQIQGNSAFETADLHGGSPLNYFNPDDIESIDILKDADATSIYGSRAANGAILITSKKGKAGKTKLNLGFQQGWGKVTRKIAMLNTRQYLDMRYEGFRHDGKAIGSLTPNASNYDITFWDSTRYTDWQKELIGGTARYTNINLGMSGGSSTLQYLIGATYNRQTTVFPGEFNNKSGGVHFNVSGESANQRLKMQFSGTYQYNQNGLPGKDLTQSAVLLEPDAPSLYKDDGTLNWAPNSAGTSTWYNPLVYTVSKDFTNTTKNLVSNLRLGYKILSGLEFQSNLGYSTLTAESYNPSRIESARPEDRASFTRTTTFGNRSQNSWIIEPQIAYEGKIGKGNLTGTIGTTIQKNSYNYLTVVGSGFSSDLLMKTLMAATSVYIGGSGSGITRFNAGFGRINYIFDDRYIINLTGRRDGSNKFGDANKFHNFGSAALGWIFSQEDWIRNHCSFLSFGKIRFSYGITGNDQIPDFSYLSIYNINNPTVGYQGNVGLNVINTPNPYLQWEETTKWQGGIDLGLMKDRVIINVTHARNYSSNQLVGYPLPSIDGFAFISKNLPAVIRNTSWEFTLNSVNIRTRNLGWSTSINLTIPKNKLIKFPDIESTSYASGDNGLVVGEPLGVKKVYRYAGINPANGKHYLIDSHGNPVTNVSTANKTMISLLSTYYGGIINTITYKGFQLDFLFEFVRKTGSRDMYWNNGNVYPGNFGAEPANQPITVMNRWQKPGDNSMIPPFSTTTFSPIGFPTSSDIGYSFDASYIRLKTLSFSWNIPDRLLKKFGLKAGSIYFQGQNIATVSKYSGLDPETNSITSLPPLQMWTLGGQIGF